MNENGLVREPPVVGKEGDDGEKQEILDPPSGRVDEGVKRIHAKFPKKEARGEDDADDERGWGLSLLPAGDVAVRELEDEQDQASGQDEEAETVHLGLPSRSSRRRRG